MSFLRHFSSDRYFGALMWLLSLQYYVVQLVVALTYGQNNHYSLSSNTISDLGNTSCDIYRNRLVCSPLHNAMNLSFIVLGFTMFLGAYALSKYFAGNWLTKAGFINMALAGIGTELVGLFPENTISGLHIIGAGLTFILGNIGMIILGTQLKQLPKSMRKYSLISGLVGFIALILFFKHIYVGIGIGGMERITAYPQSIWMIVLGIYLLKSPHNTKAHSSLIR